MLSLEKIRADKLPPLKPEEFKAVFNYAGHASTETIEAEFLNGLEDTPYNRAMLHARKVFGNREDDFISFYIRANALGQLLASGTLIQWVNSDPKDPSTHYIHDAVFTAAATTKLTSKGKFPNQKFMENIAAAAK